MLWWVIWWIISTFFSSAGTIFWKKALDITTGMSNFWFMFFWRVSWLLIILYFLFSWKTNLFFLDYRYFLFICIIIFIWIISWIIWQYVYQREKLSTVAPYENLNKIFSIILSFFLFWNISIISLWISLLVIVIIFFFSVNLKNISFPTNIKIFSFNQILVTFNIVSVWFILSNISPFNYFVFENLLWIIVLLLLMLKKNDFKKLSWASKKFYSNRLLASFLWTISYLISLYIISSYWVVINILLSFLYLFFILIFSYLFLWDKPEKKNIYLSLIVSILVWLWFYFK